MFNDDGTGRVEQTARFRVQTAAAVQQLGQLAFGFSAASESLTVAYVRVEKADGGVVVAPAGAVQELTGSVAREAPVYSDFREKHVTVPGLRPGEVLEYRVVRTVYRPLAPGHFWLHHDFINDAPVLEETVELDVPARRAVTVITRAGPEPETARDGARVRYRWRHEQLHPAREQREIFWRQPAPDISVTTFESWEAVGAWYRELESERVRFTPEIRTRAEELVAGSANAVDTVRALYDYVSREFRYVSLSFGLGRIQPHFATDVLENHYGDCKDKHTLLAALLAAVGRDAHAALVHSSRLLDRSAPSPGQFDHLVTAVPLGDTLLWLDTTAEVAPFGLLLTNLRGKVALVTSSADTASLVSIPQDPPFPTAESVEVTGSLDAIGRLATDVRYRVRGDVEVMLRAVFRQTPRTQWERALEGTAASMGVPGTVGAWEVADPEKTDRPFELAISITSDQEWSGTSLRLRVPLPSLALEASDENDAGPDSTFFLGSPSEFRRELRLTLGRGVKVRAPIDVNLERDYAVYRSRYLVQDTVLVAERTLKTMAHELPVTRRADFAAFVRAVEADEAQSLVFERDMSGLSAVAEAADVDQLHGAGLAALENGELERAHELLAAVVARDSMHQWAWNNLGRAYMRMGQLDSAEAAFRRQIAINPYDEYAHNNLGLVLWRSGRFEPAIAAFRQQIAVNPFDDYAHGNLGRLYAQLDRFDEALPALRTAVSLTPDAASVWATLGNVELEIGNADSALAAFTRAVRLDDGDPGTRNNAAYTLAQHDAHLEQARVWSEEAVESLTARARRLQLVGSTIADNVATLQLAHELSAYWDTLGWIYFKLGRLDDADRYLSAAWSLGQRSVIGDHLGQLRERQGRTTAAREAYARALAAGRAGDGPRDRLERVIGDAGRVEAVVYEARRELVRLRSIEHELPNALDAEGMVMLLVGGDGRVRDARAVSGDEGMHRVAAALKARTMPMVAPGGEEIAIVRLAVVACADDACDVSLVRSGDVFSFLRERRID